jgi:hypothetical protein
LLEHSILVFPDKEVCDVLLKRQLQCFLLSHVPSPGSGLPRKCAAAR